MKNIISAILIAIITILIVAPASAEPFADSLSSNGIFYAAPTWLVIQCSVFVVTVSYICLMLLTIHSKQRERNECGVILLSIVITIGITPFLVITIMQIFFALVY